MQRLQYPYNEYYICYIWYAITLYSIPDTNKIYIVSINISSGSVAMLDPILSMIEQFHKK